MQVPAHRAWKQPHKSHTYQLGGTEVPTATQEKDLGVIVTENLKVSEQCAKMTKTANKVLGIIKWSYEDFCSYTLLLLYLLKFGLHEMSFATIYDLDYIYCIYSVHNVHICGVK